MSDERFLERYVSDQLSVEDRDFLFENGHGFAARGDHTFFGFASRWANRINATKNLNYIILVPTLRCNLKCDYCQVSRVAENSSGFDWDDETCSQVLELLRGLPKNEIKIEFQGGEPLLRLDIIEKIRSFCRNHFDQAEFVVCTNLQDVSASAWRFLGAPDTQISTSFDGNSDIHRKQRTKSHAAHTEFLSNLDRAMSELGPRQVSALPTIDPLHPPEPQSVINSFVALGFRSIFLRRVNYQGFARKKYTFDSAQTKWAEYYRRFVFALIEHNATASEVVEEYYLTHILRRILRGGHNNHVDLRNPNWLGTDYLVVDFDGKFYPTDEARMVSRVGQIDLSIGSLEDGLDEGKLSVLNAEASNQHDPDCVHCVYQAYCGLDLVDDLSRYGRIDMPRHETDHCRTHLQLFDLAFDLIYSNDEKVRKSLAGWLSVPNFSSALAPRHS